MNIFKILATGLTLFALSSTAFFANLSAEDDAQKKIFVHETAIQNGDNSYQLLITGKAVRTKFLMKVYTVAHYLENPVVGDLDAVLKQVFSQDRAKQLTFVWERDVEQQKVQGGFLESFHQVLDANQFANLQAEIYQFLGFYNQDVKENDEHVLQWIPGGIVVLYVNGEQKGTIVSDNFAESLWSIWFGSDSSVNRKKLLKWVLAK